MKKYKIAAALMIVHGALMELGGVFALLPSLLVGSEQYDIGRYFAFKLPYFQDNLHLMLFMGGHIRNTAPDRGNGFAEEQAVGLGLIHNKLCRYAGLDDIHVARRNRGRNTGRQCFAPDADPVFRRQEDRGIR